jgi:DNA-directed RNA polymerase subunit RPC12/RpoP
VSTTLTSWSLGARRCSDCWTTFNATGLDVRLDPKTKRFYVECPNCKFHEPVSADIPPRYQREAKERAEREAGR